MIIQFRSLSRLTYIIFIIQKQRLTQVECEYLCSVIFSTVNKLCVETEQELLNIIISTIYEY